MHTYYTKSSHTVHTEIYDSALRFLRGVAYREFTRLIHGYLGRRRIPLLARTYHEIRHKFPDTTAYVGFEDEEDI